VSQPTYTDELDGLDLARQRTWSGTRPALAQSARRRATSAFLIDLAALSATVLAFWGPGRGISRVGLVVMALTVLAGFALHGRYTPSRRRAFGLELSSVVQITAVGVIAGAAAGLLFGSNPAVAELLIVWLVVASLACASRGTLLAARSLSTLREPPLRTLIVGAGHVGQLAASRIFETPALGLLPVGYLDKEPHTAAAVPGAPELPVLGASWDLEDVIEDEGIESVLIAFSTAPHEVMLDIVRRCWRMGVDVQIVPRLWEVEGARSRIEHIGALPLVNLRPADPRSPRLEVKYWLDRLVAAVALMALAPLLLVIAVAVRLTAGGPVLYRQLRIGRDERAFEMLKFRTMRDAPGDSDAAWAAELLGLEHPGEAPASGHDRRTPLGRLLRRTSLDELPQLWNVVRGDMAIVGPRPERAHYAELFGRAIHRYPDRHRVKSGLTGWAQVHGLRGETSLEDRVEWDNWYIENWSMALDARIVARTLKAVVNGSGS
jgi:exopolysaccharide biosynthesis polyprenyl glycosylphosphotransferase